MPRPLPPPTPGSSSDIRGKVGTSNAPAFNLPPTAFPEADRASNSSPSNNGSDSSYHPISPSTTTHNPRKRPVAQPAMSVITKDDFSLPPPPTRSRKIIQMKPRELEQDATQQAAATGASGKTSSTNTQSGKKNNGKSTTAAGRKIARKTAHSLIERRRRSKMNEEFGVLKDMIPACQGQDMHKLAILSVCSFIEHLASVVFSNTKSQAGIEYLRYLEQCVTDLQAQNNNQPRPPPPVARPTVDDEVDSDDEMAEGHDAEPQPQPQPQSNTQASRTQSTASTYEPPAPLQKTNSIISLPSLSQMTTNSPSVFSGTASARHYSVSSTSQASYSPYIHSNQASPAFGPQLSHIPQYTGPGFGLGSPALQPLDSGSQAHHLRQIAEGATDQLSSDRELSRTATPRQGARSELELDQEATAALLMLNSDRRQWRGTGIGKPGDGRRESGGGGMSVRDLLSG